MQVKNNANKNTATIILENTAISRIKTNGIKIKAYKESHSQLKIHFNLHVYNKIACSANRVLA